MNLLLICLCYFLVLYTHCLGDWFTLNTDLRACAIIHNKIFCYGSIYSITFWLRCLTLMCICRKEITFTCSTDSRFMKKSGNGFFCLPMFDIDNVMVLEVLLGMGSFISVDWSKLMKV